ncbi:MAG: hypothetical protein JSV89_20975 [Spirochaetaceae bacterium]|nr:MAG: hypothetical protein JSV89_20975 [Spirochaetaceae bacterium]
MYFRAADTFGYADLQGNLHYVGQTLHNLSLSDTGFISYGSVPDHVVFMNTRGEFQFSIKSFGYPLLDPSGQVQYSINTDRSGLKRIDSEGEILWSMGFSAPLTTIALAEEECVVGLMDGRALVIGAAGEVEHQQTIDGSRIPVMLAAAVSADRNRIALISGIDPQFLSVVQRRDGELITEFNLELSSDFRREVQLRFSPDTRFLFYEVEDGLAVLDVRRRSTVEFGAAGVLRSLDSSGELTAAAFRRAEGSGLLILRPLDAVILSRELAAEHVYVKVLGGSLILALDDVLLRADLVEG